MFAFEMIITFPSYTAMSLTCIFPPCSGSMHLSIYGMYIEFVAFIHKREMQFRVTLAGLTFLTAGELRI